MTKTNNPENPVVVSEKDMGLTTNNANPTKEGDKSSDEPPARATVRELFQFATLTDKFLLLVATLCAFGNGISQPLLFLVFSEVIGLFGSFQVDSVINPEVAGQNLQNAVNRLAITFVIIGAATFVVAYFQRSLWSIIGERQVLRIRDKYYYSVLSQDMGWFDSASSGEVATRLAGDVDKIQEGISDKLGLLAQYMATFFGGFIIALIKGWKLTLVLLSVVPLLAGCGMLFGKLIADSSSGGMGAYGEAGSIAAEVLAAIRTVYSFDAVAREVKRYTEAIDKARTKGLRKAIFSGLAMGIVLALIFLSYALAMWYGGQLIKSREYGPQDVLVVFFNVLVGSMTLGQTSPSLSALATAQGAAASILKVIYTKSKINPFELTDAMKSTQSKMSPVKGNIEFRNIKFAYPNRPDRVVLNNISFSVPVGKTVALVGSSGSGKSTTVGLLERFYDPQSGQVLLDGVDLKQLSTPFIREHIGLVGQEPTLFATSIRDNLLFGLPDNYDKSSAQTLVENACKAANIHKFITSLPKGYDTLVGEKGGQLSGGQKQRIAIARAIIKNPPILLLDEATSALDTESERTVQKALESAAENRTTLVIAHRLSTIQHADMILVFDKGQIVERGNHAELVQLGGVYNDLVLKQSIRSENESSEIKATDDDKIVVGFNDSKVQEQEEDEVDTGMIRMVTRASTEIDPVKLRQQQLSKEKLPIFRVFGLAKPWFKLLFLGTFGSMLDGAVWPVYSVLLTRVTQSFLDVMTPGREEIGSNGINLWALMFVVLAICCFIAGFFKVGVLSMLGEHITFEVRKRSFAALTRQEVAYYDEPLNGLGTLTARLSTEADQVQGLISKVYGAWASAIACVLVGLGLAFGAGWKLTLVALACVPLTAFGQLSELAALSGGNPKTKKIYQQVSQIAMESVVQIRTLAALSKEALFYEDYLQRVKLAHQISVRGFLTSALGYGVAMGSPHLVNALVFWYGTTLVVSGEYNYQDMFQIITSIMFMGMSIGFVSAEMGTLVKSKIAAIEVFQLWDREPIIDSSSTYGSKSISLKGNFDLSDAKFSYPSRKDVPILQGLDLSILADKKVALVGASGSGKSTIVSLLQRFYDLNSGKTTAERQDIKQWNIPHLRSSMSVVGQEPVLFDLSIEDNIRYGALNPETVTSKDIVRVAKLANAHDFISALPEGYKTSVGERGSQISGGQKQRIAIARALIRNPRVLLLDEATSALDSQSESIVQDALDRAAENRTTITIAHRLSTVQDSDCIVVMKQGKLVEMGTHDELLSKHGYYHSLVHSQAL